MAETLHIQLKGAVQLQKNLSRHATISSIIMAKAINASLAELHKEAEDRNFRFKTPRSQRTGALQASFGRGIRLASPFQLKGSIGPTVTYAKYVHEGTGRGIQRNPFMERMLKNAGGRIEKHFEKALDLIARKIATI